MNNPEADAGLPEPYRVHVSGLDPKDWHDVAPLRLKRMSSSYGLESIYDDESLWPPHDEWEKHERQGLMAKCGLLEGMAAESLNFDYYAWVKHRQPKHDIGEYVLSQGFNVPLIRDQDQWDEALTQGVAMLRSELPQDYAGQQGILGSIVLRQASEHAYFESPVNAVLLRSLRAGEISEADFMRAYCWERNVSKYYQNVASFEVPREYQLHELNHDFQMSASRWRHLDGLNVRFFKDPVVAGRYHYAARSWEPHHSRSSGWVDADHYDQNITEARSDTLPLTANRVIEMYDAIADLPRFDQTNCPVMELQFDELGILHFLQYYKTRHSYDPQDAFNLPSAPKLSHVRGTTGSDGWERRLYIRPNRLDRRLIGQACFADFDIFDGHAASFLTQMADVTIDDGYLTMASNHSVASMVYGSKVGLSTWASNGATEQLSNIREDIWRQQRAGERRNAYVNAKITANGREAVIESDYVLHYDEV